MQTKINFIHVLMKKYYKLNFNIHFAEAVECIQAESICSNMGLALDKRWKSEGGLLELELSTVGCNVVLHSWGRGKWDGKKGMTFIKIPAKSIQQQQKCLASFWSRSKIKCYRHLKAHKKFILGDKYNEITCRASQKYFQSSESENLAAEGCIILQLISGKCSRTEVWKGSWFALVGQEWLKPIPERQKAEEGLFQQVLLEWRFFSMFTILSSYSWAFCSQFFITFFWSSCCRQELN